MTFSQLACHEHSSIVAVACGRYFAEKHWLANNVLGLAFSVQGIEHLSLGAVSTGVILLSGLFFYDIFWVFCTPVMVSVVSCRSIQGNCLRQSGSHAVHA